MNQLEFTVEQQMDKMEILSRHILDSKGNYSVDGYNEFKRELDRIKDLYPTVNALYHLKDFYCYSNLH